MAKVLFVCTQNAGRSQMSEVLFARLVDGRHQARSAGTRPAQRVHPTVQEAMGEVGIDLAGRRPQALTDELAQWPDVVVTMGCGDSCPVIAGKRYLEWDLADPADQSLAEVRLIREEIQTRVMRLAESL